MSATRIASARARYRLPRFRADARERLDGALRGVLDTHLEAAFVEAGASKDEIVCIDRLDIEVHLRLAATDAALVRDWGSALRVAVRNRLAEGGAGVVRYRTRGAAIRDAVEEASRGRLERSWAWRQAGIWEPHVGGESESWATRSAAALLGDPTLIVPVLASLSQSGAIRRLLRTWHSKTWTDLTRAALVAASAPTVLLEMVATPDLEVSGNGDHQPIPGHRDSLTGEGGASRVSSGTVGSKSFDTPSIRSRLRATAVSGSVILSRTKGEAQFPPTIARCIGILGALESDPALLRRSGPLPAMLVDDLQRVVAGGAARSGPRRVALAPSDPQAVAECEAPGVSAASLSESQAPGSPPAAVPRKTDTGAGQVHALGENPAGSVPVRPDPSAAVAAVDPSMAELATPRSDDGSSPGTQSDVADTWFGGLLFAVRVLDDIGVEDRIDGLPALADRSCRWVLHRIGLGLTGSEDRDPATLAFCGLPPSAEPPSAGPRPVSPDELASVASLVSDIRSGVARRFGQVELPDDTFSALWTRRATVEADPGWIQVTYALEDARADVRRSGLDANPDYVPLLGVVMRFVYA